ncbi:MAG TPA: adenylate/guanylate cyclase domain-containing protein, partial [Pilimelia sp.]|nr:adenylate/guanylate cyclase domain-containing protein [Pilimelia sp.]
GAFCTRCGAPRTDRAEPSPAPATLEDRRRISVQFVDLIDFTPYVEQADPEQVRHLQTGFFHTARQVIGRYGGVVEKYIGDAVMALFGAPVATEADALRCVRAGLELQRTLSRFAPVGRDELRFRVGVSTGEALVDVLAARDGGQAIVAGDVVNTASRMQSVAPPGGVLVCGTTYALTNTEIRYAPQPPVTLRGRSTPTEVWLALDAIQRRLPDQEPDATPLVDRDHELNLLVNALHRALRDRMPQLVTIFGHAGIGKSRLVRELYRHSDRLLDEPITWRTGRCPPFGENVTYAALADIVKAEAGILDTDDAATADKRLSAAVRSLVSASAADGHARVAAMPEAERLTDALRPLVGLPGPKLPAEEAESAWRRFLIAMARRRPTVLAIEDLHCADRTMLRFVELLGACARDVPLLLLGTARPELIDREPGWAGTISGSLTITLPPLRPTAIASLYASLFGQAVFASDMLRPLVELADGNPLYAQEYVRMLIERGALRQSGRGWTLDTGQDLPMPDSVHAVIANRLDLLDATDRTVLLAAAVVGMEFWPGAVAAALGQPVDLVERALRRLEQRDFVYEQIGSTMAGQGSYRFRHVLVRDVCYRRLPRTERMARHERTADWLEGLSRTRDTDLAEVLGRHRWAAYEIATSLGQNPAGLIGKTRDALHRAARRAYALNAPDVAADHAARALGLYGDEPPGLGRLQLELLADELSLFRDGQAFVAGGGVERLTGLADALHGHGDPAGAAHAWTLLGQAAVMRADRDGAMVRLDRAVELFEQLPDSAEKATAYAELGRLHMLNYEQAPALASSEAAQEIAERLGLMEVQANARTTIGTVRFHGGDPAGLDELHAVVEFCRHHQLMAVRRATQNLASALRENGDWLRSEQQLREDGEQVAGQALTTNYSGDSMRAFFEGDVAQMLTAADAFIDTPAEGWDLKVRGLRACLRVLRAGDRGDIDDVEPLLKLGRECGFHRPHWTALAHGALCRALQGRSHEAVALLDELSDTFTPMRILASGEWVPVAAFGAALAGPQACRTVRRMVEVVGFQTPWMQAASATAGGALAGFAGDHRAAADGHARAARIFADILDATDRMLALALTAGAHARAGDDAAAGAAATEVARFAARNQTPGILRLAAPARPRAEDSTHAA